MGKPSDKNNIDSEFTVVKNWANSFNPPVAVYLGEFGTDNIYGYSYKTGDLHLVTANNPPNGTGYADGGPDPNSKLNFMDTLLMQQLIEDFLFLPGMQVDKHQRQFT